MIEPICQVSHVFYCSCWHSLICCFFFWLFLSGLADIILQDTDSEVLNLLDPSSPEIVVGNISLACSVEVWTTRQLPFSDLLVETVTTILL